MREDRQTESVVVTKTVRLIAPFVFTFGLFTMFHGAKSAGGGFQGGTVVASVVVTIAFAFGIDQTGQWLNQTVLTAFTVLGVAVFAVVGIVTAVYGGTFLEFTAYPGSKGALYAIELVEVGIGVTVAATIVILFFEISGGFDAEGEYE
ncbi:MnhB domain-containing protein [Halorussus salinisoli]|uniref:MnhB domain-containing protein n=1 Tax=Halorussus salinisoli TaxID=2558242 RepID=UPI002A91D82B|nr:MnhB domain-containing protein [Halorussus salinisoli]